MIFLNGLLQVPPHQTRSELLSPSQILWVRGVWRARFWFWYYTGTARSIIAFKFTELSSFKAILIGFDCELENVLLECAVQDSLLSSATKKEHALKISHLKAAYECFGQRLILKEAYWRIWPKTSDWFNWLFGWCSSSRKMIPAPAKLSQGSRHFSWWPHSRTLSTWFGKHVRICGSESCMAFVSNQDLPDDSSSKSGKKSGCLQKLHWLVGNLNPKFGISNGLREGVVNHCPYRIFIEWMLLDAESSSEITELFKAVNFFLTIHNLTQNVERCLWNAGKQAYCFVCGLCYALVPEQFVAGKKDWTMFFHGELHVIGWRYHCRTPSKFSAGASKFRKTDPWKNIALRGLNYTIYWLDFASKEIKIVIT